ncbi:MAG: ArsB/NhaD family transporter [Eggerthellaceae bacterium]|nr:ArsB/NhaD family transporter [Eggerthellaceae bacterium]
MLTSAQIISIIVFVGVMALVASEKVHRCVAALAGALILIITGVISFDTGISHIDFNTIGVLLGMMLFVSVVKESGLFEFAAIAAAKKAKGDPWRIMVAFILITAVLSAFLDNVTTVLLVGPMTLVVCKLLETNPVPYFVTEIMASNIGGTATLIGDPPNIMIGSNAGLTFFDFIANDAPAVIIILVVVIVVFKFVYGRKLDSSEEDRKKVMELEPKDHIRDLALFKKSLAMIALVVVGFMLHGQLGLDSSVIALSAACIMLLIGKADLELSVFSVEWTTIGFFCGLFMVVGALSETGVITMLAQWLMSITNDNPLALMLVILWASAIISSILDNIPFVATMIPIITAIGATGVDVSSLWWALSLGACLGGNGTLIGASANVVLSSISTKEGYPITFMDFTKEGMPIMLLTVAVATVYCIVRYAPALFA